MENLTREQFKQALKRIIKHKTPLEVLDPCSASSFQANLYLIDLKIEKSECSEIIKIYTSFNPNGKEVISFVIESKTEELKFYADLNEEELIIGNTSLSSEFDAKFMIRKMEV